MVSANVCLGPLLVLARIEKKEILITEKDLKLKTII
jgi:hypothetical protein